MLHVPIKASDQAAEFTPWRMIVREHLNPSAGERLFRIGLVPSSGALDWRAGDIAEFEMPDGQVRSYSIASVPSEGRLDLLVRETRTAEGKRGYGTAWLLHQTRSGDLIRLRLRSNKAFHDPGGDGPLLLIGAGSGFAGLRPHILEALETKRPAWLLYGDKHCESHSHLCREMQAWHLNGVLYRSNLAFSHPDPGQGRYVQDVISQYASDIRHFMGAGGRVMVCGGRALGAAVQLALGQAMGEAWMGEALADRRYRQALF